MKNKLIFIIGFITFSINSLFAQTVSLRVAQISYSSVDPDGLGPATGSVLIKFELIASNPGILADGIPFSMVYQSSKLMATPSNSAVKSGMLASAPTTWNQTIFNSAGNTVSVSYGGQSFDKRTIISFSEPSGTPNVAVSTTFSSYAEVTYWTLGSTYPQGGYLTLEPGATVPQNSLSSDGGLTQYPYLSPNLNTPLALGSSALPVTYTNFTATCNDKGALVKWTTGTELNDDYFELQRSKDGNDWITVTKVKAIGNSTIETNYQIIDVLGGTSLYRLKQYDLNGNFNYSSITKNSCDNRSREISIYPVPANDILHVVIKTDKTLKIPLEIYDALGRLIKTINYNVVAGSNNIAISLAGLANGQFVIRSTEPTFYVNKKFTIVH